jgi:hypothetical protein
VEAIVVIAKHFAAKQISQEPGKAEKQPLIDPGSGVISTILQPAESTTKSLCLCRLQTTELPMPEKEAGELQTFGRS